MSLLRGIVLILQGAESFTPADAGFDKFYTVTAHQKSGYTFEMDYTNKQSLSLLL